MPENSVSQIVIDAKGIGKSFPGVRALDGVRLRVAAGEFHAILGENGAGKSTLMNILSGVFPADEGVIAHMGQKVVFQEPGDAQEMGISMIHQELNLVPYLSIAENIFLGREFRTRFGFIDYRKMNTEASRWLKQLDLDIDPATRVEQLRVGQQQIIEIAKALSFDSNVIIMDEPTSAISEHEVDVLFDQITALKKRGVSIIYITHKLDEVWRAADAITVLRDGKHVQSGRLDEFSREDAIRLMVGREFDQNSASSTSVAGPEVLRVEDITLPHPSRRGRLLLENVSLSVREGEVLGLFGLMGAGRTELLETLFGLHSKRATGEIYLGGEPVDLRSPLDAIAAGIGLAPEDRKVDGLVLGMSVKENTGLATLERNSRWGFVCNRAEDAQATRYAERLRVKTPSLAQAVRNLSGGNQQKVVLAKWLATDPKVLLLDEPTRGIDINAKKEIYRLIDELKSAGMSIVLVSSELPEILSLSDRITVLCEGRKTAEFDREEASEQRLLQAALPGITT